MRPSRRRDADGRLPHDSAPSHALRSRVFDRGHELDTHELLVGRRQLDRRHRRGLGPLCSCHEIHTDRRHENRGGHLHRRSHSYPSDHESAGPDTVTVAIRASS